MKEILSSDFISAACDYYWLQEKEYPQRLIYKIVCDRYKLDTIQRVIVYRGIFPSREAEKRKLKYLASLNEINLSVDVSNVLFKIANYLYGRPVFLCNDSLLRDAGDAFDKEFSTEIVQRSLNMIVEFLSALTLISVKFLIDTPVDGMQAIHNQLEGSLTLFKYPAAIRNVYPADHFLTGPEPHVIATADSEVIDKLSYPFFDLARYILDKHFHPEYLSMEEVLKKCSK